VLTQGLLQERIDVVHERIAAAAGRAGRDPAGVALVAVTKMQRPETVAMAFAAGLRTFGENRVEEAGPKAAEVARLIAPASPPAWHMIGHLQSRKAGDAFPWASMVHSVDSLKLAERLSRLGVNARAAGDIVGEPLPVLLEVNISGEESKYGLAPAELPAVVEAVSGLEGIRLRGLMTMAPMSANPDLVRPVFAGLRALRDELVCQVPGLDLPELSMGMTDDFEAAVEEGATMVRIGRAIFG
jgi:PLP dependent protein